VAIIGIMTEQKGGRGSVSSMPSVALGSKVISRGSIIATGTGLEVDIWSVTFLQKDSIPSVQKLVEILQRKDTIDQADFRKLLQRALQLALTGSLTEQHRALLLSEPIWLNVFTGLVDLLRCAIRQKVKDTVLAADLTKLHFPPSFATDIVQAFSKKRPELELASQDAGISLPSISDVQWRVDVTISTTSLSRVFKPTIIMQLTLTDGTLKAFECSLENFHQLRYNVAKVLKNMQDLEQHPALKLLD